MAVSLEQFVKRLVRSGLMTAKEVAAFQDSLPADGRPDYAQGLARELVKAGRLTKYQNQCLYRGKTKGLVLGEYVVLDEIGAGGMGRVLKARHRTMERLVALKVLSAKRMDSPEAIKRFHREVKAAARLEHPNVVAAYDAGQSDGMHFLVMQYVDGYDLAQLIHKHGPLSVDQAIDCIIQAARGLEYAHGEGVVHRDIKPGNLLLDKKGTVKVLDMGLARIEEQIGPTDPTGTEQLTSDDQVMGTMDYMAPEQAENTHQADHRADIYSLGCTFYRLLTARRPYPGDTNVQILLAHRESPIPSLRDARDDVSPELDAVFQRMLAKRPDDRQQSMTAVIAELEACAAGGQSGEGVAVSKSSDSALSRFLTQLSQGGTVTRTLAPPALDETASVQFRQETGTSLSRPPSAARRKLLRLFGVVAGLAGFVVLVGGVIVLVRGRNDEQLPGATAGLPGSAAIDQSSLLNEPITIGPPGARPKPVSIKIARDPEAWKIEPGEAISGSAPVAQPAALPGVAAWSLETVSHRGGLYAVAYHPDGHQLATGGGDGLVRIWDSQTGKLVRMLVGNGHRIHSLAWSPDGKVLAVGTYSANAIFVWQPDTGTLLRKLDTPVSAASLAWSPDGRKLAGGGREINVWELPLDQPPRTFEGHPGGVAWSPGGRLLASWSHDGTVRLWEPDSGNLLRTWEYAEGQVLSLAWSPDGRMIAYGQTPWVTIRDVESGQLVRKFRGNASGTWGLGWSPDGKTLVAGAYKSDVAARAWDVQTSRLLWQTDQQVAPLGSWSVDWSPDGQALAVATRGGACVILSGRSGEVLHVLPGNSNEALAIAFSPDGARIASGRAYTDSAVRVSSVDSGECLAELPVGGMVYGLGWSPDRNRLAANIVRGTANTCILDVSTGNVLHKLEKPLMSTYRASWSPDGSLLAVSGAPATLWNATTGQPVCDLPGKGQGLDFTSDGRLLAVGDGQEVKLFDVETQKVTATFDGFVAPLFNLAWSGDDTRLLATDHKKVYLCQRETGQVRACPQGSILPYSGWYALGWSEDDKSLFCGSAIMANISDPAGKEPLRNINGIANDLSLRACAFSPRRGLVAFGGANLIRFNRIDDGQLLRSLLMLPDRRNVLISPEGHYRGPPDVEKAFVYVVLTEQGEQLTLTPEEFTKQYGWKNDPAKVGGRDGDTGEAHRDWAAG